jgi:hypothetical protein
MAALANMVIADALGTPVNHTFVPIGQNKDGVFEWQDQSAASNPLGVPIGFNKILVSAQMSKDVNAGKGKFALDYRFIMPTLETVSNSTQSGILPAATWGYDCAMFIKWVVSARSTAQNRLDLFKMGPLGFQDNQVKEWARNYTMPL